MQTSARCHVNFNCRFPLMILSKLTGEDVRFANEVSGLSCCNDVTFMVTVFSSTSRPDSVPLISSSC